MILKKKTFKSLLSRAKIQVGGTINNVPASLLPATPTLFNRRALGPAQVPATLLTPPISLPGELLVSEDTLKYFPLCKASPDLLTSCHSWPPDQVRVTHSSFDISSVPYEVIITLMTLYISLPLSIARTISDVFLYPQTLTCSRYSIKSLSYCLC